MEKLLPRCSLSWRIVCALAAAAIALAPSPATAQYLGPDHGGRGGGVWHDRGGGYSRGGFYGGGYEGRGDPRGGYRDRRGYPRGYDRRRCRDGTGGTIIGAIAGGLLGNAMSGYRDRAAGTIVGGGVGALAGNAIGRDC